jgi:hypothetical protein
MIKRAIAAALATAVLGGSAQNADAATLSKRDAATVTCRFRARLVPDAADRKRHWWPIACRGTAQARRLRDGRLQGSPRDYVCRTVRS